MVRVWVVNAAVGVVLCIHWLLYLVVFKGV